MRVAVVPELIEPLLRHAGSWTHRDRQQHHRFRFEVPDGTDELRIRFRWGPIQVGSRHERNLVTLSLFGPNGFRGAAVRERPEHGIMVGESSATPGFLVGPLPPGEWLIVLDTAEILNNGAESGHVEYQVEADARISRATRDPGRPTGRPSSAAHASRQPRRHGERWYHGDLHSHTVHSDGSITVEDRARGAVARGLDFLAITDHNTISQNRSDDPWPDELSPIRGCELTTFHGHLSILGLGEVVDWRDAARGRGAAGILDQVARQNAIAVINHPSAFGNPWCAGCHWDFAQVDYARLDGIEVWNGRWAEPETDNAGALALWTDLLDAGLRPTATAGTDSHSAEEDRYPAIPYTYVHAADDSEGSILDGIRRGRVFLSSGPSLTFRAVGSDGVAINLPGAELPSDGRFDLVVDVEELPAPATLWYVTSGSMSALGECRSPRMHLAHESLAAAGWWRLELRQGSEPVGDLLALTNPVYVAAVGTSPRTEGSRP